mmetsp:Transcript_2442/g.3567  ORF Transcript_2442/g.3567 Transcript_2442/m.3567 type:complete len:1057 (+) Transcript_2442:150-3320(+)
MPKWDYAPVPTDESLRNLERRTEDIEEDVPREPLIGGSNSPYRSRKMGNRGDDFEDGDTMMTKRMPYCLGMLVLLAIIYVLSRTETIQTKLGEECQPTEFDIGEYRKERLSLTPPHIIECAEAGEGGSQSACHLPRSKRYSALGQKGATLWMTGLSGSGKSTIATALEEMLVLQYSKHVYRLDGDNIRTGLNRDLDFTDNDRAESVRRVGELACLFSDSGVITIVSLVSPFRGDRDAVRRRHEEQGIQFYEVFMDVSLETVRERDPKGLYDKVDKGEIKGFTGVDAPYEPPLKPEIRLPNSEMTVEECVAELYSKLETEGILTASVSNSKSDPSGLPMPDGDEIIDLIVPSHLRHERISEAMTLPKVLLNDIDLNWLQTVGEGWASPLKGFMREGTLLQTLHFSSYLTDSHNTTGQYSFNEKQTDFSNMPSNQPPNRISSSVPIVLPCTSYTKSLIESSGANSITLTSKDGTEVAILRNPEIYKNRKEEIVTRIFGIIDHGHPYINHIYSGGDWLIGGEVELLDRIRYNDGLDKWRLTAREIRDEFSRKGADVVYAFQTRNPTHAGHAYLMKTAGEKLKSEGYKRPILWLSPLGGWTKSDDVPLDVRVKQHEAVLSEGMLDPETTVMAIWPAPMIYAGPTEVQFHAKSRRSGGASYFVVGRDPAGMKGSSEAEASPDDDLYDPQHGRYVLALSPGLNGMKMLDFAQVYYDKKTHTMTAPDSSRPDDFISISGSKMRKLAAQGAKPCPKDKPIPSDLLASNCIPPGFMVPSGWAIVCDYYQHVDDKVWIPYSRINRPRLPPMSHNSYSEGTYGSKDFTLYIRDHKTGKVISPWHEIELIAPGDDASKYSRDEFYNMVVEIPNGVTAKMEVQKDKGANPIKQDLSNDQPRYYSYGVPFFNYGLFPQTWEDPSSTSTRGGDNDPIDVMELGEGPLPMGEVVPVRILGSLELIDEGETDHKVLALRSTDPLAYRVYNMDDLEIERPGTLDLLRDWLINYKTTDGKPKNSLRNDDPTLPYQAADIVRETHRKWQDLNEGKITYQDKDFCLNGSLQQNCDYP